MQNRSGAIDWIEKPSGRVSVEGVRQKVVRKFWKDIFSAENWEGQPRDRKGRWITVHTKPKEGISQTPDTEDLEALAEAINIVDPTFLSGLETSTKIETLLSVAGGDSEEKPCRVI